MSSLLDAREAELGSRDAFSFALLGVISYGLKLERALSRLPPSQVSSLVASKDVEVVLGLISLWQRTNAELTSWRRHTRPAVVTTPPRQVRRDADLLR